MEDERNGWVLKPEGFDDLLTGNTEGLSEMQILLMRAIQSWEALELGAIPEDILEHLGEWYTQHIVDAHLLEMFLRGDLYFQGFTGNYDDELAFSVSPQGLKRVRDDAIAKGDEVPDWVSEQFLEVPED